MKKVLVLRTVNKDLTSYGGFRWPEKGYVSCPDWNPKPECGGGLHGLLWGQGDYSLLSDDPDAKWQVVEVDESKLVKIDEQKCKFPEGNVLYTGSMGDALALVLAHQWHIDTVIEATASAPIIAETEGEGDDPSGYSALIGSSGNYAQIGSSGDSAQIGSSGDYARIGSSGNYAQIGSSGDYARIASSGYSARIGSSGYSARIGSSGNYALIGSSGNYAQIGSSGVSAQIASSGDSARIGSSGYSARIGSSGDSARIGSSGERARIGSSGNYARIEVTGKNAIIACASPDPVISCGENGCFSAPWWDEKSGRFRIAVAYVGEDGIKPNTRYTVQNGKFVEVQ